MKVMFSAITLALLCLNLNGQSIDKLFEKYSEKENATKIIINKNVLKLFSDDPKTYESLKDINGIEILVLDEEDNLPLDEYKSLLKKVEKFNLEELVTIRSKGSFVDFMFDEDGLYLKNLIMMARSEESTFLLRLDGRILREHLDDIDINFQGMNHLEKLGRV